MPELEALGGVPLEKMAVERSMVWVGLRLLVDSAVTHKEEQQMVRSFKAANQGAQEMLEEQAEEEGAIGAAALVGMATLHQETPAVVVALDTMTQCS